MKKSLKITCGVVAGFVCPLLSLAQSGDATGDAGGLQGVLDRLYAEMLPQCSQLIGVGQALAGFAALWAIGVRVMHHIARAEPVDVFPLLRPFAIGGAIMLFPSLIGVMNGVLQPTVAGTAAMEKNATDAIALMLQQKEEAMKGTIDYKMYVGPDGSGDEALWEALNPSPPITHPLSFMTSSFEFAMAKAYYNTKNHIKQWMSEILQVVYEAAALCINTIRSFQLIVLAILGPLVLGFSVFDGFQNTMGAWLARYINVFLWLPVANIFGAIIANIQVNMIKLDISQIQANGSTYFSPTDVGYMIFLIIGICGYFTVPSVAGFIINAGSNGSMVSKVTGLASTGARMVANGVGSVVTAAVSRMSGGGSGNKDKISGKK